MTICVRHNPRSTLGRLTRPLASLRDGPAVPGALDPSETRPQREAAAAIAPARRSRSTGAGGTAGLPARQAAGSAVLCGHYLK